MNMVCVVCLHFNRIFQRYESQFRASDWFRQSSLEWSWLPFWLGFYYWRWLISLKYLVDFARTFSRKLQLRKTLPTIPSNFPFCQRLRRLDELIDWHSWLRFSAQEKNLSPERDKFDAILLQERGRFLVWLVEKLAPFAPKLIAVVCWYELWKVCCCLTFNISSEYLATFGLEEFEKFLVSWKKNIFSKRLDFFEKKK